MGLFSTLAKDDKKARIKVLKEEPCRVTLSISVSAERLGEETEKAFTGIQAQAKIPGFRPGKAPIETVRKNFSELASERARENLLQEAVREAITTQNIEPVQTPIVKSMNFQPGQPFSFELEVERAPRIELRNYKGLKLTKKVGKVSENEVTARIEEIRNANARLIESAKTPVETGLFAVVDYEGFMDGKPLPGAKGTQVLVDTANPQMISGLAEGIIGMTKGQTKEIPVDFPMDSPSKSLAGKQVVFKVTLQAIKEKQLPNLDDEFAKDTGCSSLDDLKSKIKSSLEERATHEARQSLEDQVVENLLELHEVPVPPSLLEEQTQYQMESEKERWVKQGGALEEWTQQQPAIAAKVKPECERQLRWAYLMREICRQENVSVEEAEIKETIDKVISSANAQEKPLLQQVLEQRRDRIASDIRNRKVFDLLITQAKVKESE